MRTSGYFTSNMN